MLAGDGRIIRGVIAVAVRAGMVMFREFELAGESVRYENSELYSGTGRLRGGTGGGRGTAAK